MKENKREWTCSRDEMGQSNSIGEIRKAVGKPKQRWEENIQIQNWCLVVFQI
jgi:hypothetical protein